MDYLKVIDIAQKWGMNRVHVSEYCKKGRIPGAKRKGRDWYVPEDAGKPANERTERKAGYLSATKMAEKWCVSRQFVCELCRNRRVPGAKFINGYWHIPEDAACPTNPLRRWKRDKDEEETEQRKFQTGAV